MCRYIFEYECECKCTASVQSSDIIKLPEPRTDGSFSLEKALKERRSIRQFGNGSLSLDEVSQLLWACQGITDDKGHRTAPSGMETYPLEVYLVTGNISGLPAGVYHFIPDGQHMEPLMQGDLQAKFADQAVGQGWVEMAPSIFVITAVPERMIKIAGPGSVKFVYVEGGLAAENFLLEAVSLGLGSTYVGGFDPNKTEQFLGLASGEEPVAVLPVGRKA
ncbi:MAG TPA: SagB/ThcOx family dehydrogenase [Methanotrichaceae archaeon]|nr:SagB/ThcOx family dehydrogenase [Methanotrichaceae archaeon]